MDERTAMYRCSKSCWNLSKENSFVAGDIPAIFVARMSFDARLRTERRDVIVRFGCRATKYAANPCNFSTGSKKDIERISDSIKISRTMCSSSSLSNDSFSLKSFPVLEDRRRGCRCFFEGPTSIIPKRFPSMIFRIVA